MTTILVMFKFWTGASEAPEVISEATGSGSSKKHRRMRGWWRHRRHG